MKPAMRMTLKSTEKPVPEGVDRADFCARNAPMILIRLLLVALLLPAAAAADEIFIEVLGVAQDAGLPQANCYRPHCMRAWDDPELRLRLGQVLLMQDEVEAALLRHL